MFFALDHRLEALCRLLMEETENHCSLGPLYFESLAHALAVNVLTQVCDQARASRNVVAAPPGVWRAVQRLEERFAHPVCLQELAVLAGLSQRHFVRSFQRATGRTPHQYLLRVRLSHARQLMAQQTEVMPLAEIAVTCGFFDQAHLGWHFRRAFGTTPAAFRQTQAL